MWQETPKKTSVRKRGVLLSANYLLDFHGSAFAAGLSLVWQETLPKKNISSKKGSSALSTVSAGLS
jgi:hypothetical protein